MLIAWCGLNRQLPALKKAALGMKHEWELESAGTDETARVARGGLYVLEAISTLRRYVSSPDHMSLTIENPAKGGPNATLWRHTELVKALCRPFKTHR